MFISAATIYVVFELMQKDFFYEEMLRKYFSKKDTREEFNQELMVFLFENPDKITDIWNKKYFKYYYLSVVKNQVMSSTSSWHKNFRKPLNQLVDSIPEQTEEVNFFIEEELLEKEKLNKKKIICINKALNHFEALDPWFKTNSVFFKEYYIKNLNIRDISKKYKASSSTVHRQIHEAKHMVRWWIKKYNNNLNIKL